MKKAAKGQRRGSFRDKYLALTISLLLSFVFAQSQTISYTPMTAAGYQFKYLKSDSGQNIPFRDTALGRGTTRPGAIVCNTSDTLIYFYTGRKWVKIGTATGGGTTGAFVDSVTISGNQLFYWVSGTGYGKQINKLDSLHVSNDSVYTCIAGTCTFKFTSDSTLIYTDYTIDTSLTANPGFITISVHRASLDSLVHRGIDTGAYIPDNYVLAYDSSLQIWHPVNLPTYPGFSVTGYNVDNSDPQNPVILPVQVDGVTITGTGVLGDPFVSSGGLGSTTADSTITATGGQTVFPFSSVPASKADYWVSVWGVLVDPALYTNTSGITFASGLVAGDKVRYHRTK